MTGSILKILVLDEDSVKFVDLLADVHPVSLQVQLEGDSPDISILLARASEEEDIRPASDIKRTLPPDV